MSNQAVGSIYQRIITDVVDSSQIDFEESGVARSTLDELRELWQQKLSSLMVATFPWDPAQAGIGSGSGASSANHPNTSAPTNGRHGKQQHGSSSAVPTPSFTPTTGADGGVRIKTEPGMEGLTDVSSVATNAPMRAPPANATPAAQRAATLLQQKFGSQANESIGAMQSGQEKIKVEPGTSSSSSSGRNGLNSTAGAGQTDGAGEEWVVARAMSRLDGNQDDAEKERGYADDVIRRHVEERGIAMEGGGLMLPLREHHQLSKPGRGRRGGHARRRGITVLQPSSSTLLTPLHESYDHHISHPSEGSGFDGATDGPSSNKIKLEPMGQDDDESDHLDPKIEEDDEEDEKDEDAINSDLDDPEEDGDPNGEDEEGQSQIMLCMYDKVTRTKNKWKCVLKDGVLTVGGREYVFQRANGEFEW